MKQSCQVSGYLKKHENSNRVEIRDREFEDACYIQTYYEPVKSNGRITLLKVKLITGKTHQIRAHLSYMGHSIIGDYKYGSRKVNEYYKREYGIRYQMLHAAQVIFPDIGGELSYLSGLNLNAGLPKEFNHILKGELK